MTRWLALAFVLIFSLPGLIRPVYGAENSEPVVYIIPIRENIMPPLVYLVRRGVKEAMEAKADVLVLDMETNGGRVDTTEEIIQILGQFPGLTATFVNTKAFSAGAFISFATQKIYMAPQSVIGAAAPVLMSPGASGTQDMPDTMEVKTTSAVAALVRAHAEKNGHNVEVADAMVKKTKELIIDGKVLNERGQILTLTNREAEEEYGDPPKPLLSAGTVETIDALLADLGMPAARQVYVNPTGTEKLGFWINAISPILLLIGMVCLYIEFKTPGFGIFGIAGIIAFGIYFLGGYVAGLSGAAWILVFILGLILLGLEIFVIPGTFVAGFLGVALVLVALVMAMVDIYPGVPLPSVAISKESLRQSLQNLLFAMIGSMVIAAILFRLLPHTPLYGALVSQSASGEGSVRELDQKHAALQGQVGTTISPLRPGGKAQFGESIVDVMSQGEMIASGRKVRVIGRRGTEALVEAVS
jgi:membrane-bound serine protease (ClpP class)